MRIAVLDVGSNSAHLKILELVGTGPLIPVSSVKQPTRLAEAIGPDDRIERDAVERLVSAVQEAVEVARDSDADELIAFATSAVRDAANRCDIVDEVTERTGITLRFLSGEDEARLTFLAARAWYGWSAGPLLLADIGGGSLEIAAGPGAEPELALSLPLGAGRLTRERLPGDPPRRKDVKRLHEYVEAQLAGRLQPMDGYAIATSKTFTQLARLTKGPDDVLERTALDPAIRKLARLSTRKRAGLKGVSASRAHQILAGAVVAEAVMTVLDLGRMRICPWALREGIALRRRQQLPPGDDDIAHLIQPIPGRPAHLRPLTAVGGQRGASSRSGDRCVSPVR
jgi:exopolyphosphatase/guanosine-5'-triphosphate,3'-diphosphate pyrophosphatase